MIKALGKINTDIAREMYLRCNAQLEAFYNDDEEESLQLIDRAIELSPNIPYGRMVKFDICEKFNLMEEMEKIFEYFNNSENKQKYLNNIIIFKSIILAKKGKVSEAINYFDNSIKYFTQEAKDKFMSKLERYNEE